MILSSTIYEKWKLCMFLSLNFCLILLYFLNQNDKFLSFSISSKTMTNLSNLPYSEPPNPSIIYVPPILTPPPTISKIIEFSKPTNFTFELKQEKQSSPVFKNLAKKNLTVLKMGTKAMKKESKIVKRCDIFDGKWVYKDEEKPSYDSIKCPFIEEKMSCQKNGRPDFEYEKWRWEAKDCDIPLFNATNMLERLRNKRVVIVGDSLNRNMWQSLACLLYSSQNPSRFEVNAKIRDYKFLKAKDYNTVIEFHWSPFLVEFNEGRKNSKRILVLDKISSNSKLWQGADIMVFNSGHWWTHRGKFKRWDYFQYKKQLKEKMPVLLAYDIGMKTWANWVQKYVNPKKTTVFFRSISSTHNVGKNWCYNSTRPIEDDSYEITFPKSMINITERSIKEIRKIDVKYLNITKLSKYRNDAHPSLYRTSRWQMFTSKYKRLIPSYADCSHWCLPGVPDTWNRLLYASLFYT